MDHDRLTEKRIDDLTARCLAREIPLHTDLLGLTGQDIFTRKTGRLPGIRAFLWGGFEGAERKAGFLVPERFCEEEGLAFARETVTALRAELPRVGTGETLSHRDWLGSVMNLGIDRGKVGDILPDEGGAWILCLEEMADYLSENLCRVRHSSVRTGRGVLPESITDPAGEVLEFSVASPRIDSVAAGAFRLSRAKAAALIAAEQVLINGKIAGSASAELKDGDVITVRHFGRAVFRGCSGKSKKGRLFVTAEVFR